MNKNRDSDHFSLIMSICKKWSLSLLLIFTISGCGRNPVGELRQFPKNYFKDKVSQSPGFSEGVGSTQEKATAEKIIDLGRKQTKEYDFGDGSSKTLTIKAWEALNKKNEKGVLLYTERCIKLYQEQARTQSGSLAGFPEKASVDKYQAMNDVGACYFVQGEFFKYNKDWQKAKDAYKTLIDEYPFAQYWDPRGWYWLPAEIAKDEIRKIDQGYYEK